MMKLLRNIITINENKHNELNNAELNKANINDNKHNKNS